MTQKNRIDALRIDPVSLPPGLSQRQSLPPKEIIMWHCSTPFGFSTMGGFHPLGGVFPLLFWAALILVIIWVIKRITSQGNNSARPDTHRAMTILDNRLARGEISTEEYRETKHTLGIKPAT
jgi:uncharacterized membrane protein